MEPGEVEAIFHRAVERPVQMACKVLKRVGESFYLGLENFSSVFTTFITCGEVSRSRRDAFLLYVPSF